MQCGTTRASLKVGVAPTMEVTMSESDARPFVGRYAFRETRPWPGFAGMTALIVTFEIRDDTDTLRGTGTRNPWVADAKSGRGEAVRRDRLPPHATVDRRLAGRRGRRIRTSKASPSRSMSKTAIRSA